MEKLTIFIEEKLAPPLIRLSETRYLQALQHTFMTMMPYMIIGALAVLVLNLGGLFNANTGLNMPGVADAINNFIAPHRPWLGQITRITIDIMGIMTAVLNGYYLATYYSKKNNKISGIVGGSLGFVSFLAFIDISALSANFGWPTFILGAPSIFGAIFISIAAIEIYRCLVEKNVTIKMPDGVPPMVTAAFTSLIPVTVVIIVMSIIGMAFEGFDLLQVINQAFSHLVVAGSGPVPQFIGWMLDRILWFVGLHGSNIVGSVMGPIWQTSAAENVAAFEAGQAIPHMFTSGWINFYVRISVLPIALLCWQSRSKRFKSLGKLAMPGSIFNIAEPIMFGLPIVLNPLMFVPWVFGFGLMFIFFAILGVFGITPPVIAPVVWTMPAPLGAWIGTGFNIIAPILSLLAYVMLYFIFYPFFKIMEKQELANEAKFANEDAAVENKKE